MIHVFQIHKETIETVPGGKEGRDSFDIEILGMEGVPSGMVEAKRIELFGEPSNKKPKLEKGHPYLTHPLLAEGVVPANQIIIPGTTPSAVNQQLGSMHPARQMMMASAGGAGMPMFGIPGFPAGVPLPLVLPPAPPPKPWPPVQPPPGGPSGADGAGEPKMAAARPPSGGRPLIMGGVGKPSLELKPPPPAAVSAPVPLPPAPVPVPPPPVAAPAPPVPKPVPVPSLPAPVPKIAAPPPAPVTPAPVPGLPVAAEEEKSAPAAEVAAPPTVKPAGLPTPDPEEENRKKMRKSVLIYEDRKFSQEEKRAMHPKYSAFLNRRITTLSNSIEERLRSLR